MIYVMKNGEVVETGTHDELIANKAHYYDMVSVQEPQELAGREGQVNKVFSLNIITALPINFVTIYLALLTN